MARPIADLSAEELRAVARQEGIEDFAIKAKATLREELAERGIVEAPLPWPDDEQVQVSGPQPTDPVPRAPMTSADLQALLENPDLPAEHQSAPPLEKLNPHIY